MLLIDKVAFVKYIRSMREGCKRKSGRESSEQLQQPAHAKSEDDRVGTIVNGLDGTETETDSRRYEDSSG